MGWLSLLGRFLNEWGGLRSGSRWSWKPSRSLPIVIINNNNDLQSRMDPIPESTLLCFIVCMNGEARNSPFPSFLSFLATCLRLEVNLRSCGCSKKIVGGISCWCECVSAVCVSTVCVSAVCVCPGCCSVKGLSCVSVTLIRGEQL